MGSSELKGITFCCFPAVQSDHGLPDASQFSTWKELVEATRQAHQGAQGVAMDPGHCQPISYRDAEILLLRRCQAHSFPEEVTALKAQKPVPNHSHLASLAPEWDSSTCLLRVGGRLQRLQNPDIGEIHPIVLDQFQVQSAQCSSLWWSMGKVCSIKAGLQVAVGSQTVSEDVLYTTLVEVEGILNSKPLGYVSAYIADPDPITPNMLLMGRRDPALPQVAQDGATVRCLLTSFGSSSPAATCPRCRRDRSGRSHWVI